MSSVCSCRDGVSSATGREKARTCGGSRMPAIWTGSRVLHPCLRWRRMEPGRRIHITGGPGSGKTWLASRISERLAVPRFDQDGEALAALARHGASPLEPPPLEVLDELRSIARAFA